MPPRLRPTASFATDAVLVGDPGRALLLAQELLVKPLMSNHARGLWGYTGRTPAGDSLTIQSTGIGGPSAALVLGELAEHGVRRVVRVGSASASPGEAAVGVGGLIVVERAIAAGGSAASFDLSAGDEVEPDPALAAALVAELGEGARPAAIASVDSAPAPGAAHRHRVAAADMQTVAVLAAARTLGIAAAAILVVFEAEGSAPIADRLREESERRAGRAAAAVLAPSKG